MQSDLLRYTTTRTMSPFARYGRTNGRHLMSIGAITLAAALTVPSPAAAQSSVQDWHMLDGARLTTVVVLDDSGQETAGRVVHLDTDALVLLVEDRERRFEATNVRRLAKKGDSLKNGALIGALVGGVLGAAAPASECSGTTLDALAPCGTQTRVVLGAIGALTGVGIGVGIDALMSGRTTVYEAPGPGSPLSPDTRRSREHSRPSGLRLHLQW